MNAKTATVVLLVCASTLLAKGGDPLDDSLIFDLALLGDTNADGKVSDTELTDALRFSASPKPTVTLTEGYAVKTEGLDPMTWKSVPTYLPFFPDVTNDEQCLWFPQHFKVQDEANKMSVSTIDIDAPAGGSDAATIFIRFYWDGVQEELLPISQRQSLAMYKWDWTTKAGFTFILNRNANESKCALSVGPGRKNVQVSDSLIEPHVWYDALVTIEPDPAIETNSIVKGWLVVPATGKRICPTVNFKSKVANQRLVYDDTVNQKLRLGSEYKARSDRWETANLGEGATKSFRGGIREVMIWNRALSAEEVNAVLARNFGREWAVGTENGSAAEFASGDDDPAEVFDPRTMPWWKMKRDLTETDRTLTLATDHAAMHYPPDAQSYARLLSIRALLDGAEPPAGTCVDIAVNGASVGVFDLGTVAGRNAKIPAASWKVGSDGKVTVTVTRTGTLAGTLSFDALWLGCGWQVGKNDNQNTDMSNESYTCDRYFAGDANWLHFVRSFLGGADNQRAASTNTFFQLTVPEEVARNYSFAFSAKIIGQGGSGTSKDKAKGSQMPLAIRLNGVDFWTTGGVPDGTVVERKFPAGSLKAGVNRFQFVNMADTAAGFDDYCWANLDYVRVEPVRPVSGLCIIFR